MKAGKKKLTGKNFFKMITAGIILSASTAATQTVGINIPPTGTQEQPAAWEHCGCDNRNDIEMYVQNIINDAQQRGMNCETAKIHTQACINVYCSICAGHPGMVERCLQTASAYFLHSPGFCLQEQPSQQLSVFPIL